MSTQKEVIIVGAGLAGLSAAYRLHEAGVDVTVLQSNDRVGGRASASTRLQRPEECRKS